MRVDSDLYRRQQYREEARRVPAMVRLYEVGDTLERGLYRFLLKDSLLTGAHCT